MNPYNLIRGAVIATAALLYAATGAAAGFTDPLDLAARPSALASQTLLLSVATAGERLVAVGPRGHIVYSDNLGRSWQQANVPVSSDLTSVFFIDAVAGWAVGHGGVILHSRDGGVSWAKQLDGREANNLLVDALEKKVAGGVDSERMKHLLAEAIRYRDAGPDKPFLDVWFSDANNGYVVGAYNLIFHTSDGGKHWEPWFDRTDNPSFFHLNAIRGIGGQFYVVGEQGLFLRLDASSNRFVALPTPYRGSLFALAVTQGAVSVFGMRGNSFRTEDGGRTWQSINTGVKSGFSGATVLEDGRIVAVTQAGQAITSQDGGLTFAPLQGISPAPFASVVRVGRDRLALVGIHGVLVQLLPKKEQ